MSNDRTQRMLAAISATISRHRMLRAGDRVGVGVSGGSDSVALLRILRELSEAQGLRLAVLHFNHSLRGADSDEDERFVAALAAQFGLPFLAGREDVAAIAREKRWNLEDAARRLRYGFFNELVSEGRIDRVAVAHTADDQAETVLARLARGTGPAGLAAIYPVKGHVVRPLVEVRRAELREFLGEVGQSWREDATNNDQTRLRSRLRHGVLPTLEEIQPAIVDNLSRLANFSREDELFWRALTRAHLGAVVRREDSSIGIRCGDLSTNLLPGIHLPEEARGAVTRRLVRGIVEELRGHCRQWTAEHAERVIELGTEGASGARAELPGVIVERSFDWLWFRATKSKRDAEELRHETRTSAVSFLRAFDLGNQSDAAAVAVPEIGRVFRLKVVDWHTCRRETGLVKFVLDRDLLDSPLVLRNWRPGDSFRPKGRRDVRKLKQFFRMERVKVSDRGAWPVLTSADSVVWTRGLPVAADFAAGETTRLGVIVTEEAL